MAAATEAPGAGGSRAGIERQPPFIAILDPATAAALWPGKTH